MCSWRNPNGFTGKVRHIDTRVGGTFSYRMEARNGDAGFDFEGTYTDIVPQQRIVYVMSDNRSVTIEFIPVDGGIRIIETFDAEDVNEAEMQRQGWQSILDRFTAYVEANA